MKKQEKLRVWIPPLTSDEATRLMIYHLEMAAAYYAATTDDDKALEMINKLMVPDGPMSKLVGYVGPSLTAARAWFRAIYEYYESMKVMKEDDDNETKLN